MQFQVGKFGLAKMPQLLMLATILLWGWPSKSTADIELLIEGAPGSSDLTFSMSGSLDYVNQDSNGFTNAAFLAFPDNFALWFAPTNNWEGQPLWNVAVATQPITPVTSSLTMTISGDVSASFSYDMLGIGGVGGGSDGFLLPTASGTVDYPAWTDANVTISVSGSAQFTLPAGLTFDDLNIGTRTSGYAYPGDVLQTVAQVPEAGSMTFATMTFLGLICWKSRRRRS